MNSKCSILIVTIICLATSLHAQHFQYENTDVSESILVQEATIGNERLQNGDEVGVFTEQNLCAGAAVIEDEDQFGIAAWGAERNNDNGFLQGEIMTFRMWDNDQDEELDTRITFINGEQGWEANGFIIITLAAIVIPEIEINQEVLNFEIIAVDEGIDIDLIISNVGRDNLEVENIEIEGEFFSVEFDEALLIEPDEQVSVVVTFSPENAGEAEGVITILSNDPMSEIVQIPLAGLGVDQIRLLPEENVFVVLPMDTVGFEVHMEGLENEEISYLWILNHGENSDTLGTEITQFVSFSELDEFEVFCQIAIRQYSSTVRWNITAEQFYIDSYSPENLMMTFRRDNVIDFNLDVRSIEGVDPEYSWLMTDREQQETNIGLEPEVGYHFDLRGDYILVGSTSYEDVAHSVIWQINVASVLHWWQPHAREFTIPIDSRVAFSVTPANVDSDSLDYQWFVDDTDAGTAVEMYHIFREVGDYAVVAVVHDGAEVDTVRWTVSALDPDNGVNDDPDRLLPTEVTLYPAYPNPFNSTTSIGYFLPRSSDVRLTTYDSAGRWVQTLEEGMNIAGEHMATLYGSDLPTGVYMLRLEAGNIVRSLKLVLLK